MYGDTTAIRALADRLRERADELRATADRLAARTEQVPWEGLAADTLRRHVRERAGALRHTAVLHDDAAEALDRHAREVDRLQDLIAAIERRFHRLLGSVGGAIDGAIDTIRHHLLPDPLTDWLRGFVPPPPGSRAWLDVDLPGVGL